MIFSKLKTPTILIVSPTFEVHTHGPSNFVRYIYNKSLSDSSINIQILSQDISQSNANSHLNIFLYKPSILYKGRGNYHQSIYLKRSILEINHRTPFDYIIFNHGIHSLSLAKLKIRPFKVISMVNDDEFLSVNSFKDYLSKRWIFHYLNRPFERMACKHADSCIVNSDYMASLISKEYSIENSKIKRLYKGVLTSAFSYKLGRPFNKNEIKVLFVKNDYKTGGLKILIQSLNQIGTYAFTLTIVGPTDGDIHKLLENKKIKSHLKFLNIGPQKRVEVAKLMHQHDILCIPSLREGLGVANIEGLATGISVVSSSAGGIPEVLAHGRAGWMAEPRNVESLMTELRDCIQSKEKRQKKSTFGYKWVKEKFSCEDMYQNFKQIINEVNNE